MKTIDKSLYAKFEAITPRSFVIKARLEKMEGLLTFLSQNDYIEKINSIKREVKRLSDFELLEELDEIGNDDYFDQEAMANLLDAAKTSGVVPEKDLFITEDDMSVINTLDFAEREALINMHWPFDYNVNVHMLKDCGIKSFRVHPVCYYYGEQYKGWSIESNGELVCIPDAEDELIRVKAYQNYIESEGVVLVEEAKAFLKIASYLTLAEFKTESVLLKKQRRNDSPALIVEQNEQLREIANSTHSPHSLHVVTTFVRYLKDERYYQGKYASWPRGSRCVVVKSHVRGLDKNMTIVAPDVGAANDSVDILTNKPAA